MKTCFLCCQLCTDAMDKYFGSRKKSNSNCWKIISVVQWGFETSQDNCWNSVCKRFRKHRQVEYYILFFYWLLKSFFWSLFSEVSHWVTNEWGIFSRQQTKFQVANLWKLYSTCLFFFLPSLWPILSESCEFVVFDIYGCLLQNFIPGNSLLLEQGHSTSAARTDCILCNQG